MDKTIGLKDLCAEYSKCEGYMRTVLSRGEFNKYMTKSPKEVMNTTFWFKDTKMFRKELSNIIRLKETATGRKCQHI